MQFEQKLYHKSLIVLAMLLSFELLFLGMLALLLVNSESEAHKYEHSMNVIKQANGLLKLYADCAGVLAFYAATGSESYRSRFDAALKAIDDSRVSLKEALKDDPAMLAEMEGLQHVLKQGSDAFIDYRREIDEHRANLPELRRRTMPVIQKTMREVKALTDKESAAADESYPKSGRLMREYMEAAIGVGVLLNIIIGLIAVRLFTSGITRRIEVLTDNSYRLASGLDLNPPMQGKDEIAYLDGVFHTMADVLDEAARKERAATDAIKESEERVRKIIENMPVGLIAINEEGMILSTNPRTETIFGYEQKQLQGKHLQELFAGDLDEDQKTFMQMIQQRAYGRTCELTAKRSSGENFPGDIALNEFETDKGLQLLVNVQDVTDRHEAERLKREFVAMVSHDLRTPLTSLSGSLALLSAGVLGDLPADALEAVTSADSDVSRLMRLINDLLDVARIEAGKMEMVFDHISLAYVIKTSLDSLHSFADLSGITIETSVTAVRVLADPDRLVQVLVNLLSNAIKFSPPGSKVEIAVEEVPGWVEVRVRDFGRGVPDQYKEAIFEKFQQVDSGDATKKGGSGLGLPICKTIIEQHGGTIGVLSEENEGSTFWFRLRALEN